MASEAATGTNIIVGRNGQGKTTLLKALLADAPRVIDSLGDVRYKQPP